MEPQALPLLYRSEGKLEVNMHTRAMLLENFRECDSLAPVCITGLARCGKSTLLNLLLQLETGRPGSFPTSNSHETCTTGMWAWSHPVRWGDKWLLLLDCEGLGLSEESLDIPLLAAAFLFSSVCVLNFFRVWDRSTWKRLRELMQFRNWLSQPAGTDIAHLMLLWRDYAFDQTVKGKKLEPSELLEHYLQHCNDSLDMVRNALREQFQNKLHLFLLPQPSTEELQLLSSLSSTDPNRSASPVKFHKKSQYHNAVVNFNSSLKSIAHPKFLDEALWCYYTPSRYFSMIATVVSEINQSKVINTHTETFEDAFCAEVQDTCVREFESFMSAYISHANSSDFVGEIKKKKQTQLQWLREALESNFVPPLKADRMLTKIDQHLTLLTEKAFASKLAEDKDKADALLRNCVGEFRQKALKLTKNNMHKLSKKLHTLQKASLGSLEEDLKRAGLMSGVAEATMKDARSDTDFQIASLIEEAQHFKRQRQKERLLMFLGALGLRAILGKYV